MSDFDAWMAASEAPGMTCSTCGDEIIWRRDRKRWEHIGTYDHEADGPPPIGSRKDKWRRAAVVYAASSSLPPVPAPAYIYRATVVGNHDADTLTVDVHLGFEVTFTTNVRLLGMNARELSAPGGKEARDHVAALLPPGTVVTISSEKVDKYGGRYDATVTYLGADGQPHDLAGDLIAGQWGAPYDGTGPTSAHVPPWPRTVA